MLATPWAKLMRYRAEIASVATASLLVGLVIFACYQRLFSSFATNDDEGYVMVSLQMFLGGGSLYDEVYSQYGPAYYWIASAFHGVTDWPITHDFTRFKTLAIWVAVALLAAAWIFRETKSQMIAGIGLLFVTWHLERLSMEPGHPQELCLLAVAVCLFLALFVRGTRRDGVVFVMAGLATAVCIMTKVNVGLFLLISFSAAMLFVTQRGLLQRILLYASLAAMVALPLIIGRHQLFDAVGYRLPVLVSLSIGLVIWCINQLELRPVLKLTHTFCYWSAIVAVSIVICIATLAHGTSVSGLLNGILLQHMQFVDIHYHAPPINAFAPPVALLAIWLGRGVVKGTIKPHIVYATMMVLLLSASVCHLVETFHPLYHGSQDRGQVGMLVSFLLPFAWIVLLPLLAVRRDCGAVDPQALRGTGQETHPTNEFARIALCLTAVLQPLIAHPVPGTQMAIGSVALIIVALVSMHDFVAALGSRGLGVGWVSRPVHDRETGQETHPTNVIATHWCLGSIMMLLLLATVCRGGFLWNERQQLESSKLKGAERLALPAARVAEVEWIDDQLGDDCDTFVAWPSGRNSLYLFTGIKPPTGFNATCWPDLLNDDQQLAIVEAIQSARSPRVVIDHDEPKSDRPPGPLLAYVRSNFDSVARRGAIEILDRKSVE